MFKPSYNYRGIPIVPSAKNVYRPGQYGRGRKKTVLFLLLLILAILLIFAIWGILSPDDGGVEGKAQESTSSEYKAPAAEEFKAHEEELLPAPAAPETMISEETEEKAPPQAAPARTSSAPQEAQAAESMETPEQFAAYRKIDRAVKAGRYAEARDMLDTFLKDLPVENRYYKHAQKLLDKVSDELRRSGAFAAGFSEYTVKSGDSLSKIAAKAKTSMRAIIKASSLENPDRLRVGQKLKIPRNSWRVILSAGKKKLHVYESGKLVKIYSLNPARIPALKRSGSFRVRSSTPNQEWKIYGLGLADIQDLLKFIPAGTTVQIKE